MSPTERKLRALGERAWPRLAAAAGLVAAALVIAVLFGTVNIAPMPARTWTFEGAATDPASLGFETSSKEAGEWRVVDHEGASGNRALVNLAGDPTAPAASAIAQNSVMRDLKAATRCKSSAGRRLQSCGLVFRYIDRANYYVARVDVGRGEVSLGVVVRGVERPIKSALSDVSGTWQELAVVAQADHLLVALNGRELFTVRDPTLPSAGRIGVWAPADGEAYFDELSFAVLPATRAHPSDLLPILLRRRT